MTANNFNTIYNNNLSEFEKFLQRKINSLICPETLKNSMLYSLNAGGKRLRPVLFRLAHNNYSVPEESSDIFSLAIECIHTYSLIHDDLPVIDNDDYRRGRPSNHKIFGEDIALLAGDGLLNYAYELISEALIKNPSEKYIRAFYELAAAAGIDGMVGGQTVDIEAGKKNNNSAETLNYIHRNKTSKLITAALICGALTGDAPDVDLKHIREYGENLGMLFQITDDILDITGNKAVLGKTTGKDADKITYPNVYGLEKSYTLAREYCDKAVSAIKNIGNNEIFTSICENVLNREK